MSNIFMWTDDPEADAERYFQYEDTMSWDERIDRLRDETPIDDLEADYGRDW